MPGGVTFTVPGEPKSKSRHKTGVRGGRVYHYKDQKTADAQAVVGLMYRQAAGPGSPGEGGYGVDAQFHLKGRQRRDIDNFVKLIFDGLTGYAWVDDSQVTELHAKAIHGASEPRSVVNVYPTDDLPDRKSAACQHCGERFPTYDSWNGQRKYCKAECRKAAVNLRRERTCSECGASFRAAKAKRENPFCSVECKATHGQVNAVCSYCAKAFTMAKSKNKARSGQRAYCNSECQAAYWRTSRAAAAKGICNVCGGNTSKKTYERCNSCRIAGKSISG